MCTLTNRVLGKTRDAGPSGQRASTVCVGEAGAETPRGEINTSPRRGRKTVPLRDRVNFGVGPLPDPGHSFRVLGFAARALVQNKGPIVAQPVSRSGCAQT